MSPVLKSAQPGRAAAPKRASPAGGAKKNTSCRVMKIRGPNNGELDTRQRLVRSRRFHGGHTILAARLHELPHQRLHRAARHEHAELRLEQPDFYVLPHRLRITLLQRGAVKLERGELQTPVHFQ
jgi:hypothetical protein